MYKKALFIFIAAGFTISCRDDKAGTQADVPETPTSGKTSVWVDNTLQPVAEDVLAVFHSVYTRAHIIQVNRTETGIVNALLSDSARVAVLPRLLTPEEEAHFLKKKITPRVTHFATDAIAFIRHGSTKDTLLSLQEVYNVMQGKESATISRLVFDNPNSSTVQYLLRQAGVTKLPIGRIYSLKSSQEVIRYVYNNPGSIGVVGANWLMQPPTELVPVVENIQILAVDNVKTVSGPKKYYKPTQSNIATGYYPLTRKLYVLNYSGIEGLGTGFANYISAPEGQRIILKSGLVPVAIPPREVNVRSEL